jgi:hypothetical protein
MRSCSAAGITLVDGVANRSISICATSHTARQCKNFNHPSTLTSKKYDGVVIVLNVMKTAS